MNLLTTIAAACLGSGGVVGIFFYFFRRYIERRLQKSEQAAEQRRLEKLKRLEIEDEIQHAQGRMFFWLYKAIVTGEHNGDLEEAFDSLQAAEEKQKQLDRKILAQHTTD